MMKIKEEHLVEVEALTSESDYQESLAERSQRAAFKARKALWDFLAEHYSIVSGEDQYLDRASWEIRDGISPEGD